MTAAHHDYNPAADATGSYYAAIESKRLRGDATAPLDYAVDDPEDDEPHKRCPLCLSVIMAACFAMIIGGLVFATFAIKEVMIWLM